MSEFKSLREKIAHEKAERKDRYAMFEQVFNEAWNAGIVAATAIVPRTMVVQDMNGNVVDVVPEGPCGFAWVRVPGNTSFAKWLVKHHRTKPGYPKGIDLWISDYGQSYERKAAHARAMSSYLIDRGIKAWSGSRLD